PVAFLVPERVLHPVLVVAIGEIGARLRAARFLARLGRDDRRARGLDEVVELERFDSRRIEDLRLVLDEGAPVARGELPDPLDPLHQVLREAEYPAIGLHDPAQVVADVGHALAGAGRIQARQAAARQLARVLRQAAMRAPPARGLPGTL